jgi:hypothetical protein
VKHEPANAEKNEDGYYLIQHLPSDEPAADKRYAHNRYSKPDECLSLRRAHPEPMEVPDSQPIGADASSKTQGRLSTLAPYQLATVPHSRSVDEALRITYA